MISGRVFHTRPLLWALFLFANAHEALLYILTKEWIMNVLPCRHFARCRH